MNKKEELKSIVQSMSVRPRMYLRDATYGEFVAFIYGYDAAHDCTLLSGFHNWLSKEKMSGRGPSCLTWCSLAIKIIFPNLDEPLPTSEHAQAIVKVTDLLTEFLSL